MKRRAHQDDHGGGALLMAAGAAKADDLTLCWAAWDPANALVELSQGVRGAVRPQDELRVRALAELRRPDAERAELGRQLCDLMIGDSQWIGGAAENGHYVKLNDFFDANGINMEDFIPATVTGYAEWPKNTPNYWALPAFGDVVGWTYRKDWFERPELQAEFKEKYGRDLAPPADASPSSRTSPSSSRAARSTARRSTAPRSTPSAAPRASPWGRSTSSTTSGSSTRTRTSPTSSRASSTRPERSQGLEFYKALYDCCTPPGASNWYMSEDIDAYKSGQVALQMNFAFIWPGVNADPNVGGDKTGLLPQSGRADGDQFAQLGGQGISVVANTPTARTRRSSTSSGSPSPRCRRSGGSWAATRR